MRRLLPALALLGGCVGEAADRWRYERVLWEREPAIRSAADARSRSEELSARSELTLDECWRLAIHRAESLALEGEELVRLQTQYEQAVAAQLPRLSFKGSYTRQDETGVAQGPFTLSERTEYKLYAKQPIFGGLREFYAIRQSEALYASKEHDLRHARLLLYADVAEAFYAVLQLERDLATTQDSLRLAQERLAELTERQKVGISRRSEVLAQEAEAASTQALVEQIKGSLAVAWEALKFLTGARAPLRLADAQPEPGPLPPADALLKRAVEARSDVRSLEGEIAAAEQGVGVARAGWLPTLTIEGSYYTHREGISESVDWDVLLSGEFPLFDGLSTQAKMREAESSVRSARLRLQERLRQIALDISRTHADVRALQGELASLEKAVASAQENCDLVQAEYRQGIVTNVEVLASFNTLQRARLDRDRARYQLKLANVRLDVQSGTVPGDAK